MVIELQKRRANARIIPRIVNSADDDDVGPDQDSGLATAEAKPELKRPSMYKVIILNDDYTPMEFVVHILESFFGMHR